MKRKELKSFFCIADGMLSDIAKLDYFQESLLMNILFSDRVVLDGAYCFNSGGVRTYMKKYKNKKDSLLSYFSRNGTITPAIRDKTIGDMWTLYHSFVDKHYKNNPSTFPNLKEKIDPFNYLFVCDLDEGLKKRNAAYLDNKISQDKNLYLKMMEGLCHQNESEILNYVKNEPDYNWFKGVWRDSEEWRYECLNEASIASIKDGGTPLKRSELFASIGKRLLGDNYNNETKSNVWLMMEKANKKQKRALSSIVAITNHLQQIELSKRYGCSIEFPIYHKVSPIVLKDQYDEKSNGFEDLPRFKSHVNMPSIKALLKIEPQKLEELKSIHFHRYRDSLIDYGKSPTSLKKRGKVKEMLGNYCDALCEEAFDTEINEITAKFKPITDVIDLTLELIPIKKIASNTFTTVLNFSGYSIQMDLWRKEVKKEIIGKPRNFDISVPSNNISNF